MLHASLPLPLVEFVVTLGDNHALSLTHALAFSDPGLSYPSILQVLWEHPQAGLAVGLQTRGGIVTHYHLELLQNHVNNNCTEQHWLKDGLRNIDCMGIGPVEDILTALIGLVDACAGAKLRGTVPAGILPNILRVGSFLFESTYSGSPSDSPLRQEYARLIREDVLASLRNKNAA